MTIEVSADRLREVARVNDDAADELAGSLGSPPELDLLGYAGPAVSRVVERAGRDAIEGARAHRAMSTAVAEVLHDFRATEDEVIRALCPDLRSRNAQAPG